MEILYVKLVYSFLKNNHTELNNQELEEMQAAYHGPKYFGIYVRNNILEGDDGGEIPLSSSLAPIKPLSLPF